MSKKTTYEIESSLKDAKIHGMVCTAYTLNERLNCYDINSSVSNQVVTITGMVNSEIDRWLGGHLIKGIEHIKKVINNLTLVKSEQAKADVKGPPAFYVWYNDTNTTAHLKSKLMWNKKISGNVINVLTEKGKVTLTGFVDYSANKALAEIITLKNERVKEVNNKIIVKQDDNF